MSETIQSKLERKRKFEEEAERLSLENTELVSCLPAVTVINRIQG